MSGYVVPEFGPGACTCHGEMTGCAVCSTGSLLLRYNKSIPRLATGHPDMRTLGYRMGKLHRAAVAGNRHGESLSGVCSPPNHGTNWCAYCALLYIRDFTDLPVGYEHLTDAQIKTHLSAGHSLIVPGLYSHVPIVAESSYSTTTPAHGRSDTGFGGSHMVHAYRSSGNDAVLADPDFGSTSRPTVPPYSEWSWSVFMSFYHAFGWPVTYINAAPKPVGPPASAYTATVRPPTGTFYSYDVRKTATHPEGQVVKRVLRKTGGFQASCTAAHTYLFAAQHSHVPLVRITSGGYADPVKFPDGFYVSSKWSNQ